MQKREYPEMAIFRARENAGDWLKGNADGYPRSWEQESFHDKRRGYVMYDDWEAPPIAGYEELERDGVVVRLETLTRNGEERIHFRLVTPTSQEPERSPASARPASPSATVERPARE